jgi:hypothetical protein
MRHSRSDPHAAHGPSATSPRGPATVLARAACSAALAVAAASALVGCSGADASERAAALPTGWSTAHSTRFEELLDRHLPLGTSTALPPAQLAELDATLDAEPPRATRAALWLARAAHPDADAVLLARLERRAAGPAREDDAGDCTAAAALARRPLDPNAVDRLVELALGDTAHPDLEVRVECAIAALDHGREDVLPLLVRVLRIDTPSEAREGALTDSPSTAWVRGRADEALCDVFDLEVAVRTDLPLAEREAWADGLERRVAERAAARAAAQSAGTQDADGR